MNLRLKREPPLPGPLLHKGVEEREADGSGVQSAKFRFGEFSPREHLLLGSNPVKAIGVRGGIRERFA